VQEYEKLGVFYLGQLYDLDAQERLDRLLLYDSRDLVTHAVCVGMTGSGKTGLCVGLLEEAALDGIPAIVIDPKGDLGNLLLTFPELRASDFRPWINEEDASQTSLGRATTAARGVGRTMKEAGDIARAKETVVARQRELEELDADFREEIAALEDKFDPMAEELEEVEVRPLKKDIAVGLVSLAWVPRWQDTRGNHTPARE
jgi:DNA helicase HerA-like ATPase